MKECKTCEFFDFTVNECLHSKGKGYENQKCLHSECKDYEEGKCYVIDGDMGR